MPDEWKYTVKDNSRKNSGSRMYINNLIGDGTGNIFLTDVQDLESTLADLTLGNIVKSNIVKTLPVGADVPPADVNAQNEIYLSVSFQDTVTLIKGSFSIPSPDPALRKANTDEVDETNSRWTDAVTTWEAAGVSRLGNPIVILGGTFEGRAQS